MNASAATIASVGAKHIAIEKSAMYLVHKCSQVVFEWAMLNADQLKDKAEEYKKTATDLEKIDLTIATMYADRCKKSVAELLDLMKENKWLTAQEALDWGFVDEIVDTAEDVHLTQSVANAMAAAGIPLPEGMPVEADGLFKQLENLFTRWFGKKKEEVTAAQAAAEPPATINNQSKGMKKVFLMVAAVLAAANLKELVAQEDGTITLDEAQMDAIEAALAQAKTDKEALEAAKTAAETAKADAETKLAEANARIAELEALPAGKNAEVIESEEHKAPEDQEELSPMAELQNTFARARKMWDEV
jgi:enoyl-CoA hydratase/carnithine racemase